MNYDPKAKPTDAKPSVSWKFLCVNTAYLDLMLAQTREICATYPVDGFFYDICFHERCFCATCSEQMTAAGVDLASDEATARWYTGRWLRFFVAARAAIAETHPEATVFFNGAANNDSPRELLEQQTHYELEDLPTTWGGYDKFPPRAKFMLRDGKAILAMSGKFHTQWGEFGGFKHPDAIRFEAASMIANGVTCSFGDQLHPHGEMDLGTYANIGAAYAYVEKIENYGPGGLPSASLGLWMTGLDRNSGPHRVGNDQGIANMLLEAQLDFEVVDAGCDLTRFQTIILTGTQCLDAEAAAKLDAYVLGGGSLLVIGESALDAAKQRLVLDVGAEYLGPARHDIDYLVAGKKLRDGIVPSPFLNYTAAMRVKPIAGAKVLATIKEPYFNRTYAHYCSHMNTCNRPEDAEHVGAIQHGRVILLPHLMGLMYFRDGARIHRDFTLNALRRLHTAPMVETTMPSCGRINLIHQPDQRRFVLHLLYGAPIQRGRALVIEDLPALRDIPVTVRLPVTVKRATLPLSKTKLKLKKAGKGALSLTVPEVACHEMVVFDY